MPKHKRTHRFGAFLQLYGRKGVKTHAVLRMGHDPRPNTPEGFLLELAKEYEITHHARGNQLATEYRLHLAADTDPRLPSYWRPK